MSKLATTSRSFKHHQDMHGLVERKGLGTSTSAALKPCGSKPDNEQDAGRFYNMQHLAPRTLSSESCWVILQQRIQTQHTAGEIEETLPKRSEGRRGTPSRLRSPDG